MGQEEGPSLLSRRVTRRNRAAACDSFTGETDVKLLKNGDALDLEFRVRAVSDLLQCPLCHGYFKDAVTLVECLHTFCKSCIAIYFNARSDKQCPVCGAEIPKYTPGVSVLKDMTVQHLVDKLFPHFGSQDEEEERQLLALCDAIEPEDPAPHKSEVKESGSSRLASPAKAEKPDATGSYVERTIEWLKCLKAGEVTQPLRLKVLLTPDSETLGELKLKRPHLRVAPQMQVKQLASLVVAKLGLSEGETEKIEFTLGGQVVPSSHTLEFICRSRRLDMNDELPLIFRL